EENQAASVAQAEPRSAFAALQQARQITDLAASLEAASREVKRAYSQCPSYDVLVPALLARPLAELREHVRFVPGVPVRPMLAKPATGVREVLDRFAGSEFSCEYKYDGERAQVHVLDGRVKIYSRNSEDSTGRFPDVAALFPRSLAPGVRSVVLDAEAVAFDRATGRPLPFQILSTRGRKDVQVDAIKVAVCVYCFDCLFCDGETLVDRPLRERREVLRRALVPAPGELEFASEASSSDVEELGKFLDEAVAAGTEGLIVKTLDGPYQPSKRASFWLKLKKDYLQGLGDTFDVVPIGAWLGKGKRTGMFGSYLLAVYDADAEEYQTICKIGTGFSEELLKQLAESLQTHVIDQPRRYYNYGETLVPDVWFEPHSVWEVKAADLSISPVHRAALGQVERNKGLSIRFPRLVRVREDKKPEDSTSPAQVADMYRRQALAPAGNGGEDEDY
ncbi:ATP dependent DNA ligase, partial [Helicosporidium sp. ATCC 50920]